MYSGVNEANTIRIGLMLIFGIARKKPGRIMSSEKIPGENGRPFTENSILNGGRLNSPEN
jgi:hypothetical protein